MYLLTCVVLALSLTGETSTQSSLKMIFADQKHCEDVAALLVAKNVGHDKPGTSHTTIAFCKKEK